MEWSLNTHTHTRTKRYLRKKTLLPFVYMNDVVSAAWAVHQRNVIMCEIVVLVLGEVGR